MAITITHKSAVYSGANQTSYVTTTAFTPTANELLIATVQNGLSGGATTPTFSGNGLTWTQLTSYLSDNSGTWCRVTMFVAKTGASPSNGAQTASFSATTQLFCEIIVDEVIGADVSGTDTNAIAQSVTGSLNTAGTSETITLAALSDSNNASYYGIGHQANELNTPGANYTGRGDGTNAGPSQSLTTGYRVPGDTTPNCSWATSAIKGGIACEIKVAGGAPPAADLATKVALIPELSNAPSLLAISGG